ncbi:hypothetical protein KIN20_032439 [Parelaphostrongylus tenuis]|uniref:Uncharacterized protein n=1 Tax=Parelaphostrongylus tenuis TaxID=148309 RepID=A0AAD5WIH6_PARTN|nr:hypothetical protein KIN20_032439 [Parelaphostrongylus tenuis]
MASVLYPIIERLYVSLVAGLFINSACAINFFVHYAISKEYRIQFDEHFRIINVKRFFAMKNTTAVNMYPMADRHPKLQLWRT